jgi:hypothetical protein
MRCSIGRVSILSAMLTASISMAPAARANGRFPRAQHVAESASDPNHLVIAATFGLLITSDRGKSWYHVCEKGFSFQDNYGGDPLLALTADESMLVGVQSSLNVSHDHGCQWAASLPAMAQQTIADFTVAKTNANTVLVIVTARGDGGAVNLVHESLDGGKTYKVVGTPLPAQDVYTIDVDPQDPTHLYATGLFKGNGVFLYSSDHAMTWVSSPIPNTSLDEVPYIAAIHPQDPKKIFVRTDAWPLVDGINTGNDALLYSADGGKTWTEIIRKSAKLLGFALSPDGSTVLAGYGDPIESAQLVDPAVLGIYKSPTSSFMFDRIVDYSITCLAWTKTGAYACASGEDSGYDLAFSQDASFKPGGCGLVPLLHRQEVKGSPPACSGSAVNMCDWSMACQVLDACDGGAPAAAAGAACTAGGAGAPGAGGSPGGDASVKGAGGSGDLGTGGGPGQPYNGGYAPSPPRADPNACGCRIDATSKSASGEVGAFVLALVSCSRFGSSRKRRRRTKVVPDHR